MRRTREALKWGVECAAKAGLNPSVLTDAGTNNVKETPRAVPNAALKKGIFGAPTLIIGSELICGDAHLEDAMNWAATHD